MLNAAPESQEDAQNDKSGNSGQCSAQSDQEEKIALPSSVCFLWPC